MEQESLTFLRRKFEARKEASSLSLFAHFLSQNIFTQSAVKMKHETKATRETFTADGNLAWNASPFMYRTFPTSMWINIENTEEDTLVHSVEENSAAGFFFWLSVAAKKIVSGLISENKVRYRKMLNQQFHRVRNYTKINFRNIFI